MSDLIEKIYANEPAVTEEEQVLLDMTPKNRQKEKAVRIKKLLPPPFEFEDTNIRIKIVEAEVKNINGQDCLDLIIEAKQNGKILEIDNHLRYFNPPLRVQNGTWRVMTKMQPNGEVIEMEIENTEYNPKVAIKQCIIQTLNFLLKNDS